jgi:hypothetical protein
MSERECKGDHQGHLCVLASKELFDRIKELTREPQYICCEQNLCNPMPLN